MSGLERRTKDRDETPGGASGVDHVIAPSASAPPRILSPEAWPAIDSDLLDERRAAVPAFPLEALPQPWRGWVSEAARPADAPVDYVAQALLATVAGVSGHHVWVVITNDWIEPLHLWLAVVGAPSTGKSPALTVVRRVLNWLEKEAIDDLDSPRRSIALSEQTLAGVEEALAKTWYGKFLWRDGAEGCFAPLKGMENARQLEALHMTILGSIETDGVRPSLRQGGDALAARFLYAWPQAQPSRPLSARKERVKDEVVTGPLQWLLRWVGTPRQGPCGLLLDQPAETAFNAFLVRLHGEIRQAEGLEAAWLGKGRGEVARLAATLELMEWSAVERAEPPLEIDAPSMERAVSLWSDYYRPHANAFLQRAMPADVECRARRVVQWLRLEARDCVSRKDVRRKALAQTVNAAESDRVLARLVEAGVLQTMPTKTHPQGGRPTLRWLVNPLLQEAGRGEA